MSQSKLRSEMFVLGYIGFKNDDKFSFPRAFLLLNTNLFENDSLFGRLNNICCFLRNVFSWGKQHKQHPKKDVEIWNQKKWEKRNSKHTVEQKYETFRERTKKLARKHPEFNNPKPFIIQHKQQKNMRSTKKHTKEKAKKQQQNLWIISHLLLSTVY